MPRKKKPKVNNQTGQTRQKTKRKNVKEWEIFHREFTHPKFSENTLGLYLKLLEKKDSSIIQKANALKEIVHKLIEDSPIIQEANALKEIALKFISQFDDRLCKANKALRKKLHEPVGKLFEDIKKIWKNKKEYSWKLILTSEEWSEQWSKQWNEIMFIIYYQLHMHLLEFRRLKFMSLFNQDDEKFISSIITAFHPSFIDSENPFTKCFEHYKKYPIRMERIMESPMGVFYQKRHEWMPGIEDDYESLVGKVTKFFEKHIQNRLIVNQIMIMEKSQDYEELVTQFRLTNQSIMWKIIECKKYIFDLDLKSKPTDMAKDWIQKVPPHFGLSMGQGRRTKVPKAITLPDLKIFYSIFMPEISLIYDSIDFN